MAFGKRRLTTAQRAATPAVMPAVSTSEDRHLGLRDLMLATHRTTGMIAEAIRTNGTVMLSGVMDEFVDASRSPIDIRDLAGHFSFSDGVAHLHPFFGYATPSQPDRIDPSAQFQLLELAIQIRNLNTHCQDAHRNEALSVALQSPQLPDIVDGILVASAFFAAYFENLATTQVFITGVAHGQPLPDFAKLKSCHDRHKLMAFDHMLNPGKLEALLPPTVWPHIGVEIARRHEAGEQFVNGIYFPAAYASQLIDRAGRVPQESDLVSA